MANKDSGVISQFVGGRITAARLIPPEPDPGNHWVKNAGLHLEVQLDGWGERELDVYTLSSSGRQVHVRVDGMFCPPEDLPEPEWLTQDAGIPRDGRGRVHWVRPTTWGIDRAKVSERSLPLWAQEILRLLRQELDLCRRALEHRNTRLREIKSRLRLLYRTLTTNGNHVMAHAIARAGLWDGYDLKAKPWQFEEGESEDDHATD